MPRVVHFEIPARNPERSIKFYSDVFGWKIAKWGGPMDYWLVATGDAKEPGIDGAISRQTTSRTVDITVSVPSVDAFIEKVTEAGGRVISPKMAIPGVGYHACCMDPDGVSFGIVEDDPNAG